MESRFYPSKFSSKPYEVQVVLIIGLIGILRLIIALAVDLQRGIVQEILTDLVIFFLILFLIVFGAKRVRTRSFYMAFGFLLMTLLAINFLQFGGLKGMSRFNYLLGIFTIILLYNGTRLYILLVFSFSVLGLLIASTFKQWSWSELFYLRANADYSDYIFALIVFGLLTYYLKELTRAEILQYEKINVKLGQSVDELRHSNGMLLDATAQLSKIQSDLSMSIAKETRALEIKSHAIQHYIELHSSSKLQGPLNELHQAILALKDTDQYTALLKHANTELYEINNLMGTKIAENMPSNRQVLSDNSIR